MTLPFGYVSVCHLPEEPRSVPCPSRAAVPGAACAQPCSPVTHQGASLAVGAAARPCPTVQRLHLQEGTFQVSHLHSALCLPPNTTPSQQIKNCLWISGSTPTKGILWGRKQIITGVLQEREQWQWEDKGGAAKQWGESGVRAERPFGHSCHCKLLTEATRRIKTFNSTNMSYFYSSYCVAGLH